MTLSRCFKVRNFILAAALISGLCLVTRATAQELQERLFLIDLNTRSVMPRVLPAVIGFTHRESTIWGR